MDTSINYIPIIFGEDSVRFNKMLKENEGKRISKEENERLEKLVRDVLANSNLK